MFVWIRIFHMLVYLNDMKLLFFIFIFIKNVGVITYFSFFKAKIKQERKRCVTLYLEKTYLQKSNLDSKLGYLLGKYDHKL